MEFTSLLCTTSTLGLIMNSLISTMLRFVPKYLAPRYIAPRYIALGAIAGLSVACTNAPTNLAQSRPDAASPSQPSGQGGMDHGKMDHGKMGHQGHNMDLGPGDADFDLRFLDGMVPHHEGAVTMAQAVLTKSQRPELKKLAQAMITAQQQEIDQMKAWRKVWYPNAPQQPVMWHSAMNHQMPMDEATVRAMRMDIDLGAADATFDQRFLDAMVPHHEGALTMAKQLQTKTKRPELQKLAQAILTSQQAEIDQMKAWRKTWYGR
jgi:uncharacterized protein (DUF305 family)